MPRSLLITSVLPWPLRRNGGAQRTELLRRALLRHGAVDVLAVGGSLFEGTPPTDEELRQCGVVAAIQPQRPERAKPRSAMGRLRELIGSHADRYRLDETVHRSLQNLHGQHHYDLIVGRYLSAAMTAGMDKITGPRRWLDFDDIDWLTLREELRHRPWPGLRGRIGASLVMRQSRSRCDGAMRHFDHLFVTSNEDARELRHQNISVLSNIPFTEAPPLPQEPASRQILFVGDLQHGPNADGLEWFLANAWPRVRTGVSDATLRIVGRGMSPSQSESWSKIPGVIASGFADDLTECYRAATATIAPVFWGGGTKIKVLETLAMGRCCVASSHALRGYAALAEQGARPAVWIADDAGRFAEGCVRLLTDQAERTARAEEGFERVRKQYTFERFCAVVDAAFGE